MKSIFLSATLICLVQIASAQTDIPEDWKLSTREASKMMQYYSDCKGDCFTSRATPDSVKETLIREAYKNARSVMWVNARYRSEDVERYASRNTQLMRIAGGTQVAGYTTKILKVIDENGSAHFFDIASICPPPSLCNSEDEAKSGNR